MSPAENSEFSVEATPVINGEASPSDQPKTSVESSPNLASDDTQWEPEKTPAHGEPDLTPTHSFDDSALALLEDADDHEKDYPVDSLLQGEPISFDNQGTVAAFQDAQTGDQFHITQLPFIIGRSELCDLVIDDGDSVALRQAELVD